MPHVTSGTTGDPVAFGFTRRDHEANSAVGGEAFRIAACARRTWSPNCLTTRSTREASPTTWRWSEVRDVVPWAPVSRRRCST